MIRIPTGRSLSKYYESLAAEKGTKMTKKNEKNENKWIKYSSFNRSVVQEVCRAQLHFLLVRHSLRIARKAADHVSDL